MSPDTRQSEDVALLLAVARRDETAFATLYGRVARPMFSLVVRIIRSEAEAEEILQESFWQIWERAPDYREALGSPFGWMITIARRKAIDRLRANSRHLQRLKEARAAADTKESATPVIFAHFAATERAAVVRSAFAQIAPAERRAIELAFFDGLTHSEIAEALKAPVGTVKARIRRGLLKLEAALGREAGMGENS